MPKEEEREGQEPASEAAEDVDGGAAAVVASEEPTPLDAFGEVWAKVDPVGNPAMMTEEKARTLYDLLQDTKPAMAVEIGTHLGRTGALIGLCLREWGGTLVSYDPYDPSRLSPAEREIMFGALSPEAVAEGAASNFRGLGLVDVIEARRRASPEAASDHQDGSLDFFFFDADHVRTRENLEAWLPKVRLGGQVVVDDANNPRVKQALATMGLEGELRGALFVHTR